MECSGLESLTHHQVNTANLHWTCAEESNDFYNIYKSYSFNSKLGGECAISFAGLMVPIGPVSEGQYAKMNLTSGARPSHNNQL